MVYMHIILFVICLNFGMGIAHILDTPLTITDAYDATNVSCFNDFQSNGVLTYVPDTPDVNGAVLSSGQFTPVTNPFVPNTGVGVFDGHWVPTAQTNTILDLNTNTNSTGYNPITQAIEQSYQAGETLKNFLMGGYITNILDHISLTCDFNPESATFGQATDTAVWQYFKTGINIVFSLLLTLAVIYIITGRSFGL